MDNEKFYEIIDTLNTIGMKEAVIDVGDEQNNAKVRTYDSYNDEPGIAVVSEIPSNVIDHTIGIGDISTLYKRMSMFDVSKMKTKTELSNEGHATTIVFSEGRRRFTYTFSHPKIFSMPTAIPESTKIAEIDFDKSMIDELSKANSAISSQYINIISVNGELRIRLFDESDDYVFVIGNFESSNWSYNWKMGQFMKVMKHAVKFNDTVRVTVTENMLFKVTIGLIDIVLMPQIV